MIRNREIYLDNAATTRAFDEVGERVRDCMCSYYGNPSSLHNKGLEAEHVLKDAGEKVAGTLKVRREQIIFTSGGTESDNMTVLGVARARKREGKHIVSSHLEHPAIQAPLEKLREEGYEISWVEPDSRGVLDPEKVAEAVRDDTILVTVMAVNNEIGSRQDIPAIARACKEKNPSVIFHSDAVQAYGKIPIYPAREKIDLLSLSSHKIHGPKGVGALYVADPKKIRPILFGGGQQGDLRPGTENIPGIAGFALAAQMVYDDFEETDFYLRTLKKRLAEGIRSLPDTHIHAFSEELAQNSGEEEALNEYAAFGSPTIVSASFRNVSAEVLLHALEERGIYVSSGSACSSNHPKVSEVLKAIHADQKDMESTLRFSISRMTEKEDIEETIRALGELLPLLRKFTRK